MSTVHRKSELGAMLFVVVAAVAFADDGRGRDSWKGAPPASVCGGWPVPDQTAWVNVSDCAPVRVA